MDAYSVVKTVHIISATILFGTGIGIANFMFFGLRTGVPALRRFASTMTVRSDFAFTLPAVVIQPLSGAWLVHMAGLDWTDLWLVATYGLYILAGACWIPVVVIQMRMKSMLDAQAGGAALNEAALDRLFRWWVTLGLPAFGGLVVVFYLMVAKPSW